MHITELCYINTELYCPRCSSILGQKAMSFFIHEYICHSCADKEAAIRKILREKQKDEMYMCGYVPEPAR